MKGKNIWQNTKKPILALAPMAGYTDSAFRLLCLKNGADIVYTEMISAEAIWRKNKKTLDMLRLLPQERNVILQLFGNHPESFEKALKFIVNHRLLFNNYSGIDINFGCPVKKVYKTGAGVALMDNKEIGRKIIQVALKNTNLPVSIKIRSKAKNTTAKEFIKFIKDLPISAVMIHGRSLKQGFSGKIDYKMIKEIKKIFPNIPILANGGIYTPEEAENVLKKTGADGIGIARGACGRPWIFKKIKTFFSQSQYPQNKYKSKRKSRLNSRPDWPETKKIMLEHAKLFLKYNSNLIPLRKQLIHYVKGLKNASELRQKIIKVKTLGDLKKI